MSHLHLTCAQILFIFIIILNVIISNGFFKMPMIKSDKQHQTILNKYKKKEKDLYSTYLIALRKQQRKIFRKTLNNITTKENTATFTSINNTQKCAENIIMGNIILDVSDVKYIHISTEKDNIKIKLDNNDKNTTTYPTNLIYNGLQNIDIIFTTVGLVGKIININ